MKYTITINQLELTESKLNLIDSAILHWLVDYCRSKNKSIQEKRIDGMTWVDYKTLLRDMPLLRIKSPGALTPRLRRIESEGYIKCAVFGNRGHQKMYISLLAKVSSLFTGVNAKSIEFTDMNNSVHDSEHKTPNSVHNGEPTITLHTNHNTSDTPSQDKPDMIALSGFDQFWTAYPKKELKKKSSEIWSAKKLGAKLPEILTFISAAKKTDRWLKGFIKQPTSFLSGECWEDDLLAYGGSTQSNFKPWVGTPTDDYNRKSIIIGNNNSK